jgi:hypothetical protein
MKKIRYAIITIALIPATAWALVAVTTTDDAVAEASYVVAKGAGKALGLTSCADGKQLGHTVESAIAYFFVGNSHTCAQPLDSGRLWNCVILGPFGKEQGTGYMSGPREALARLVQRAAKSKPVRQRMTKDLVAWTKRCELDGYWPSLLDEAERAVEEYATRRTEPAFTSCKRACDTRNDEFWGLPKGSFNRSASESCYPGCDQLPQGGMLKFVHRRHKEGVYIAEMRQTIKTIRTQFGIKAPRPARSSSDQGER